MPFGRLYLRVGTRCPVRLTKGSGVGEIIQCAQATRHVSIRPAHYEGNPVNLANSISIFRLVLIPIFIGLVLYYEPGREGVRYLAAGGLITAALSDILDGYVARRFDQRTKLGSVLDPLADKLLINLSFVFLAATPHFETDVPMWLPVVILGRDIIIAGGSYLLNKYKGPLRPRPRLLGKVATIAHSVGVAWVVLNLPYGFQILMVMVAISVVSLVDYLFHGYEEAVPAGGQVSGESD